MLVNNDLFIPVYSEHHQLMSVCVCVCLWTVIIKVKYNKQCISMCILIDYLNRTRCLIRLKRLCTCLYVRLSALIATVQENMEREWIS